MIKSLLGIAANTVLTEAIAEELHASQLYKHLANQCQRIGLFGAAKKFRDESSDELTHYQLIADYMNDRGGVAMLPDIEAIDEPVTSLVGAIKSAYDAETSLGSKYAKWYSSILSVDPITAQFLLQFLEFQRKSIGEYGDWLSRLELAGDDRCAILIIDKELGA